MINQFKIKKLKLRSGDLFKFKNRKYDNRPVMYKIVDLEQFMNYILYMYAYKEVFKEVLHGPEPYKLIALDLKKEKNEPIFMYMNQDIELNNFIKINVIETDLPRFHCILQNNSIYHIFETELYNKNIIRLTK